MIAMAKPDATFVAGFSRWKRLGRRVKRGERAIRIMAPCPVRFENPNTGEEEERLFFKTACVFDVSQTQGRELPAFDVPDVERGSADLLTALREAAKGRDVDVRFVDLPNGHYGSSKGRLIEISVGHSTGQQAKTLAHELAHESLHRSADGGVDAGTCRETKELEAEAIAYVVCRHFDLDVELRASRYIALWGGDAKKLAASFGRISGTARGLIEDIEVNRKTHPPTQPSAFLKRKLAGGLMSAKRCIAGLFSFRSHASLSRSTRRRSQIGRPVSVFD